MNPDALAILIATCIAFGIGLILTFVVPGPDKA